MSELGLGFDGDRKERRTKRKKIPQQHQQRKLVSRTTDLEKRGGFPSPSSGTSSSRSKVIREDLVQEGEGKYQEETLNLQNHSVCQSVRDTVGDLEQMEMEDEEMEEDILGPPDHFYSYSPTAQFRNPMINSEPHPFPSNKQRFSRTSSLDLNCHNAAILSPQFLVGGAGGLKKSPWTPNYQKGWCSERVPLPTNGKQRYLCNGRFLPSKWEDAERWIGSPMSVDGTGRALLLPSYYRRPKSKSGPLGPHSPLIPCFDSGRVVNMAANSPLLAGVLVADGKCYGNMKGRGGGGAGGRYITANVESYIVQQSAVVHEWSDLSSQCTTQDEKLDSKEGSIAVSPKVLQRDVATQMSPTESTRSSPKKLSPVSSLQSADPIVELEGHLSKLAIRDVQVDDQVAVTRHSKKYVGSDRCLRNIIEQKNKSENNASCLEVAEPPKFLSEYCREEAKIKAWRNLQEAKAGAAIRKLEMKLEKERSSSMEKILNKLRSAQGKAEEMRNTARASQAQISGKSSRRASFFSRSGWMSFLGSCFIGNTSRSRAVVL